MTEEVSGSDTVFDVAMEFAAAALDIARASDIDSTRQRIVDLAVARVGCQSAALWQVHRGETLRLDASTDPELVALMSSIAKDVGSLAKSCLAEGRDLSVADFTTETRWPSYVAQVLARTKIRSASAFCLTGHGQTIGVLTLYSEKPHALSIDQLSMATIYAAHAGIALQDALHADQAANLQQALQSNRRIGMALGVLIAQHKLTEQQAFDLLRAASQNNHVKLHDVAEEVILTGAAPQWPATRPRAEFNA